MNSLNSSIAELVSVYHHDYYDSHDNHNDTLTQLIIFFIPLFCVPINSPVSRYLSIRRRYLETGGLIGIGRNHSTKLALCQGRDLEKFESL